MIAPLSPLNNWSPQLYKETEKEYDALDRVVKVTLPDGSEEITEYGIRNKKSYVLVTDANGNRSEREADGRGNIVRTSRYGKEGNKVLAMGEYEYNALGELLQALDYKKNPLKAQYDMLGRRISMESADIGKKEYGYDQGGNLIWESDGVLAKSWKRIEYQYNSLNRLVKITYPKRPDTPSETKTVYFYGAPGASYNGAGRITRIKDESGASKVRYGKAGR